MLLSIKDPKGFFFSLCLLVPDVFAICSFTVQTWERKTCHPHSTHGGSADAFHTPALNPRIISFFINVPL